MGVKTKVYESRGGHTVRAIKVTERNFDDVAAWAARRRVKSATTASKISPSGDVSKQRVRLHIPHVGIRAAYVGDYVATIVGGERDGDIFVMTGHVFENKYDLVS